MGIKHQSTHPFERRFSLSIYWRLCFVSNIYPTINFTTKHGSDYCNCIFWRKINISLLSYQYFRNMLWVLETLLQVMPTETYTFYVLFLFFVFFYVIFLLVEKSEKNMIFFFINKMLAYLELLLKPIHFR